MSAAEVVQLIFGLASFALAGAVYYYTRKTVALESMRSVRDSWMQLDQTALADKDNLKIADALFNPGAPADEAEARKRSISLMALNPVVSDFMAARLGLTPHPQDSIEGCRSVLRLLLRDEFVYRLTQSGMYKGPFVDFCAEVRKEVAAG